MNFLKHTAIILSVVAFAACSEPEPAETAAPAPGKTRVTLLGAESHDVSVYVFRREGERYLYHTLFSEGWTAEGTLSVRLINGSYKFLFASGAGQNLAPTPDPFTGQTAWEEAAFTLRENGDLPGTYLPADELFLQHPAAEAEQVYTLAGEDRRIEARLRRAVCRIGVSLKRGYPSGDSYVEEAYVQPHTIREEIERIDLRAEGTGLRLTPGASSGTAAVTASLSTADYAEITPEGFLRLEGPLVIPPADGAEIGLDLTVVPAAGSALQSKTVHVTGRAERNKRLDITLWITSAYPEIGVEIRTAPIENEQPGDSGIWE